MNTLAQICYLLLLVGIGILIAFLVPPYVWLMAIIPFSILYGIVAYKVFDFESWQKQ